MASSPAKHEERTASRPTSPAETWWVRLRTDTSRRYWVCLAVLVVAAVGLKMTAQRIGWILRKEPVPLKHPLQSFDTRKLMTRYQLDRFMTDPTARRLTDEQIESLGTQEYVQVYLTDTQKAPDDPTRTAMLFVTYYTGKPDMVPHVPDECWLAGGYDPVSRATEHVPVPGVGAPNDEIPVRVLEFRARRQSQMSGGGSDVATVMYFFHANGGYTATRNGVRASTSNPFERYAYYAKIEVQFTNRGSVLAGKAASVAALGPLLERVMPVLFEDHFDLDKFASAGVADEQAQQ